MPTAQQPQAPPCPDPADMKQDPNERGKLYGKYRGTVLDNVDLLGLGRVLPYVPAVQASFLNWALPCAPYAGLEVGFFAIPPIGANVWIEFEGGNPDHPIWSGCFWEELEVPLAQELSPEDPSLVKVMRTDWISMVFNDTPEVGGVTMNVIDPAVDVPITILMNSAGIEIQCGVSNILINPEEGITLTVGDNVVAMSEAGIEINGNVVNVSSEGAVSVEAAAELNLSAGGDLSAEAGGASTVTAGGDVSVTGGGAATLTGGGDVSVTGGGAATLTGGGDVAISAAAAIQISAVGDVMTSAVTQVLNGLVEVDGDLLIDGQQPFLI